MFFLLLETSLVVKTFIPVSYAGKKILILYNLYYGDDYTTMTNTKKVYDTFVVAYLYYWVHNIILCCF